LYEQLDSLQPVRQAARRDLLPESGKHAAVKLLRQIPSIGPIRSALLVALLQTPHRFRTKRQLWAYSGFLRAFGWFAPPKSTRPMGADIVMESFRSKAPTKVNKKRTLVQTLISSTEYSVKHG